ncbi:TPA: hypothetical protein QIC06_004235 [Enterobacter kobei]|nr:hypothetical protein [Enterobacter kobei]
MLVYLCIIMFVARLLFVPLFTQFGTNGFLIHESLSVLMLFIAGLGLLSKRYERKWSPVIALILLAVVDFVFYLITKNGIYGDYPFYPRYALMSIPIIFGLFISVKRLHR